MGKWDRSEAGCNKFSRQEGLRVKEPLPSKSLSSGIYPRRREKAGSSYGHAQVNLVWVVGPLEVGMLHGIKISCSVP